MAELGLVIDGGSAGAKPAFYVLRDNSYVERLSEFLGRPALYSRTGRVRYQDQPKLNFVYRALWRAQKLRSGCVQLPWGSGAVCRVECSGKWWGIEVFRHLVAGLQGNCIAIVRESLDVVSVIVSSNGRLVTYVCEEDFAAQFGALRAEYPNHQCKFFGLRESELPSACKFEMIEISDGLGYQWLEQSIAHRILLAGADMSVPVR